jgi:starch-binding outer membrane protein, SusD/RagB family
VDSITGLPLALTDPAWNARNSELDEAASDSLTVDPRLDWTVGRDSVPYKDWGVHGPKWIREEGSAGPYGPKKNVHEKVSGAQSLVGWNTAQLNSVKMHLFRYADLLLLLAEANVEAPTGSLLEATTIVNEIRARAGVRAQGPGTTRATIAVPINDASITWARYRVGQYLATFPDQATARRAVRYERRLELAMEGQRFFDLRRWGDADTVIANYLAVERTRRGYLAGAAFAVRHHLYPLPDVQIALSRVGSEDRLVQNPDW